MNNAYTILQMIEFHPPKDYKPGIISRLLRESYEGLKENKDLNWDQFSQTFDEFDMEVFSDEDVANCTFITTEDGIPIGLGSFDPRQRPAYGDIGHNCVIPSAKGKGYGRMQIQEILRRLRGRGIKKARVSTGTGSFAAPARKMYESCGFIKTRTFAGDWSEDMVEYELQLS